MSGDYSQDSVCLPRKLAPPIRSLLSADLTTHGTASEYERSESVL